MLRVILTFREDNFGKCLVCNDEVLPTTEWPPPCRCPLRVHHRCLNTWQLDNLPKVLKCPRCRVRWKNMMYLMCKGQLDLSASETNSAAEDTRHPTERSALADFLSLKLVHLNTDLGFEEVFKVLRNLKEAQGPIVYWLQRNHTGDSASIPLILSLHFLWSAYDDCRSKREKVASLGQDYSIYLASIVRPQRKLVRDLNTGQSPLHAARAVISVHYNPPVHLLDRETYRELSELSSCTADLLSRRLEKQRTILEIRERELKKFQRLLDKEIRVMELSENSLLRSLNWLNRSRSQLPYDLSEYF